MAGRVCGRAAGLLDLLDNLVFEVDHVARVAHQACGSEGSRKRGVRARAVYTCTRKRGFNTTLQGCTRPGHARASAERLERIARGRGGFDGPNTLQHVMQVFITSTESRSPRPLQAEPHSAGGGVKRLKRKHPPCAQSAHTQDEAGNTPWSSAPETRGTRERVPGNWRGVGHSRHLVAKVLRF